MTSPTMERSQAIETDYRMITSLSIENFRCFDHLNLSDLKRITIITGASGTGKTALLEALLVAAKGHPDAVIRANKGRALPEAMAISQGNGPLGPLVALLQGMSGLTQPIFNSLWSGLFNKPEQPIGLNFTDSAGNSASLKISYNLAGQGLFPQAPGTQMESLMTARPVLFERETHGRPTEQITASLQNGQMHFSKQVDEFGPVTFYFESAAHYNEADNIIWFSDLKIKGTASRVTELLIKDFPFIKNIEVLSPGGIAAIYAVMTDDTVRSLSLVSSGIHKMFSVYCGVSDTENGIVLLDEIENGIYYEKYESLWRSLRDICQKTKNQVFVTVHSLECLQALLPLIEENQDDFCLLRTERSGSRCSIRHISGQAMKNSLRGGGVDPRGTAENA